MCECMSIKLVNLSRCYEYHKNNLLIPHDILIYLKFSTMHSIGQV